MVSEVVFGCACEDVFSYFIFFLSVAILAQDDVLALLTLTQYIMPAYTGHGGGHVDHQRHEPRFPGGTGYNTSGYITPFASAVQRSGSADSEPERDYSYLVEFIIIGDEAVGKTCLLKQFTEKRYRVTHQKTVGVEFDNRIVDVNGSRILLQCWDTAGEDRFQSIIRSYYRTAAGMLLVYDICQRDSFEHIMQWLREARDNADPELVITLIGNKADKATERKVTQQEGMSLARQNGLLFLETSGVTGHCVDEAFLSTAKHVLQKELKKHQDEMVQIPNNPMVTLGQDGYDYDYAYASLRIHHPGGDVAFGPYAEAGKAVAAALAAIARHAIARLLPSEASAREALCQQALADADAKIKEMEMLLSEHSRRIEALEAESKLPKEEKDLEIK